MPNMRNILFVSFIILTLTNTMGQQFPDNSLGKMIHYLEGEQSLLIQTDNGSVLIQVYAPDIFRIRVSRMIFTDDFSYSVVGRRYPCNVVLQELDERLSIRTDSLLLEISTNPVRFTFRTPEGQVINQDDPALGTTWVGEEVTTYKILQDGEHFLGLGEKTGNLDRRGEFHTNWNTDNFSYRTTDDEIYSSFPFYIGVHHGLCYGIYLDNTYRSYFNFGASNDRFSSFGADAGEMDYYFIAGHDIPDVIMEYTWLTGRMPMPPLWALGFQQCRWSYFPDKEVLNTARTFREKKIPLDVIYLDIHYMDAYKVFTWHPTRFPHPENLVGELKNMGVQTTVIIDPGVKVEKGYHAYEDGIARDMFINYPDGKEYTAQVWPGWCHFTDYTKASAREWWGQQFADLVGQGVTGFWNDMNEIASWGEGATPSVVRFDWEGRGASYRQAKNVYGMLMARSTYEGVRSLMNGQRPLVLTRAAFSGAQRYTAIWTGDNFASEEHMMLGCLLVNSLGISGMPFSGTDIGGFAGEASASLFARWLTIGTFTPFFRVHKAYNQNASEPWTYGEEVESIARNYISLRYRLLPYLYSAFYTSHSSGLPVNRALVLEYSGDDQCWDPEFQHQYLFGPGILVAPVESQQRFARVYLPEGQWYDFFTGEKYDGEQRLLTDAPLDKLPVFARGGGFIPMQSVIQSTSQLPSDTLYLHVYYGNAPSFFTYYEDDGISMDYDKSTFITCEFLFDPDSRQIVIGEMSGTYTSKYRHIVLVLHGFDMTQTGWKVDGRPVMTEQTKIDLYSALTENDPLFLGGRKFEQNVQILQIAGFGEKQVIAW
ncbi:MAG TPA: glycoside hydrolase family 31 protein [Bacteroidales bacterium]|nr:glycoside hydrolase family 31 protein [Bacteroidales bacterium]